MILARHNQWTSYFSREPRSRSISPCREWRRGCLWCSARWRVRARGCSQRKGLGRSWGGRAPGTSLATSFRSLGMCWSSPTPRSNKIGRWIPTSDWRQNEKAFVVINSQLSNDLNYFVVKYIPKLQASNCTRIRCAWWGAGPRMGQSRTKWLLGTVRIDTGAASKRPSTSSVLCLLALI